MLSITLPTLHEIIAPAPDVSPLTFDAYCHNGAQGSAPCSVSLKRIRPSNRKRCSSGWPASACISLAHADLEQAVVFLSIMFSSPCFPHRKSPRLDYSILSATYLTSEHHHQICATADSMDCGAHGEIQSHLETRPCHLDSAHR
jgi:hypothetical protein